MVWEDPANSIHLDFYIYTHEVNETDLEYLFDLLGGHDKALIQVVIFDSLQTTRHYKFYSQHLCNL